MFLHAKRPRAWFLRKAWVIAKQRVGRWHGNTTVNHRDTAAGRRNPALATQQGMGLCPERNARSGVGSRGCSVTDGTFMKCLSQAWRYLARLYTWIQPGSWRAIFNGPPPGHYAPFCLRDALRCRFVSHLTYPVESWLFRKEPAPSARISNACRCDAAYCWEPSPDKNEFIDILCTRPYRIYRGTKEIIRSLTGTQKGKERVMHTKVNRLCKRTIPATVALALTVPSIAFAADG